MTAKLWHPPPLEGPPPTVLITERQAQVLDGLCLGVPTPQMAAVLSLSCYTVTTHIRRLRERVGARSPEHLIALACNGGVELRVDVDRYRAPKAAAS